MGSTKATFEPRSLELTIFEIHGRSSYPPLDTRTRAPGERFAISDVVFRRYKSALPIERDNTHGRDVSGYVSGALEKSEYNER